MNIVTQKSFESLMLKLAKENLQSSYTFSNIEQQLLALGKATAYNIIACYLEQNIIEGGDVKQNLNN